MPDFTPGTEYETRDVRRALGATTVEGSILAGREGTALIVTIGKAPDRLDFPTRSSLLWFGEVPMETVNRGANVFVFVVVEGERVRFIGKGRVTSYKRVGGGLPRDVTFALEPALARSEWLKLIERQLPTTDLVPETPLASLGPDSKASDRWSALVAFIERWYGKPVDEASFAVKTRLGPPLVRKMRGLHAAVPEAIQHNELVEPYEPEEGKVVFLVENQAVCLWATEPEGEDPLVWYRNNGQGEPWIEEPERLSAFLIQTVLFEAIMHARFGARGTALPVDAVRAILEQVAPLGSGHWNWGGARFFARDGALVMTMGDDGASDVWLAARTPLALSRFEGLADDRWDRVAF